MSWGAYTQGGKLQHLESIGRALNLYIKCPVHFPAYDKRLFECKCGVIFPMWQVEAAIMTGDWSAIDLLHSGA